MKLSEDGIAFIARQEGFRARTYKDTAQKRTIGYGHKLVKNEAWPDGISEEKAKQTLATDAGFAEEVVNRVTQKPLNQAQFDALISLAYNIGAEAFTKSSIVQAINNDANNAAADDFLLWDKVRRRGMLISDPGLKRRRQEERSLFLHGIYSA